MSKIGFIGVQAADADNGISIVRIVPRGAAAAAGLKDGDIITALDGQKIQDSLDFGNMIRGRMAGDELMVRYLRDGKPNKTKVTLKERQLRDNVKNDPRMKRTLGPLSDKTTGYPDVIQHDIPLRPEMCGGPLFNLKGKCIGINVSRAGRTRTYAIPADEVVALLKTDLKPKPELVEEGATQEETRETIRSIRENMKQLERRLEQLEKSIR